MSESELERLGARAAELGLTIYEDVLVEGEQIPYFIREGQGVEGFGEACDSLDEVQRVMERFERMEHDPLDDVVYEPPDPEFEGLRPVAKSRRLAIAKSTHPTFPYFVKHRGFGTIVDCEDLDHLRRCVEDFEAVRYEIFEPAGGTSLWELFGLLGDDAKPVELEE
jgi:hypothetical protein